MAFSRKVAAALLALALGTMQAEAAKELKTPGGGGYYPQCQSSFIGVGNDGPIMSGFCPDCSYFWIGRCFANIDGVLMPANGDGSFNATCQDCTNDDWKRPGWMTCNCWTAKRGGQEPRMVSASVDLNKHIHVRDGILGCAGEKGRRCGT